MNTRQFLTLLMLALSLSAAGRQQKPRLLVADEQGIVGDGVTLNTDAIQQAIDRLSLQGGGTLRFTAGIYLTGGIVLKSGVELLIDRGAVISGSTNPDHYRSLIPSEARDNSTMALIMANEASDIAVTGSGLIDGNGRALALTIDSLLNLPTAENPQGPRTRRRASEPLRPKLFFVSNCQNIRVEGLRLLNSACWGLSFHSCRQLQVQDIQFENRAYWNNDGIDITDCHDVVIRRCDINSADDGICLKSYDTSSGNERVLIEDCQLRTSASAIKFGTASWGGFRNITVRRITIRNVFAEMPFGIPDIDYDVRGPGFSVFNPRPSSITGIPGHPVEDITLENIEIVYPGRASKGIYYYPLSQIHQVPERERDYPEFSMFGELPAWGFYVRHVRGIKFRNIRLSLKDDDFRPAFVFDDATGIEARRVSLPIMGSGQPCYARESQFIVNEME